MAGGIEEPFRLSFQIRGNLDLSHSIDLRMKLYVGRGGLVLHTIGILKRLRNTSSQDGVNSQASNDGSENTDYEGEFEHVNDIGHSVCFVENHDRAATLLENGKYQASENEGYDGDSERVNEVGDSICFEESFNGSNNGDIEVTECGGEGSSNGDIEVTKCGGEDSISCHSGPQTEQDTNSSDVLYSVTERLEAEEKFNLSAGKIQLLMIQRFLRVQKLMYLINIKGKEEAEIKQLWINLNFKETPMPAFYREPDHHSEKTRAHFIDIRYACYAAYFLRALCCFNLVGLGDKVYTDNRKRKKQRLNNYGEISISKQLTCLPFTVNLAAAQKKQGWAELGGGRTGAKATSATENTIRCLKAEAYNKCSTNERLNVADSPQVSEVTIYPSAELSDSSVPSAATSKMSKQTQLNRTVAPKREQEKRQVANSPRPRTSDSIRRNKDFKAEDKKKVLARRTGNHAMRKDVRRGHGFKSWKQPLAKIQEKLSKIFVEEIACGAYHVAVLTSRTEVYTWGKGENGRLGHGNTDDKNSPTLVEALKDKQVKSIACGTNFTAAICLHK
ncbi:hypothetical protein FXO38_23989 [Capsicum annuum]|nr:hypothetical protein FXO38_23989 [Capsicum annuum]